VNDVSVWVPGSYELPEGIRWGPSGLYFVDILAGRLLSCPRPGVATVLATLDVPLGAAAPISGVPSGWIVAAGPGIGFLHGGSLTWLARPEDSAGVPMRMNDGVCDPHGRFWAGSMSYDGVAGAGSLYRVGLDGRVVKVLENFTVPNGPAFDAIGSVMYLADSARGLIFRYSVDPETGHVTGQSLFAEVPEEHGSPDGMTVDADGRLWVAMWDGWAVRSYAPDGTPEASIEIPAARPTCVCVGPAGDSVFVTTARYGLDSPTPESGSVLTIKAVARGLLSPSFAGPALPQ
jgi:sugar lactone lactonase YvrE